MRFGGSHCKHFAFDPKLIAWPNRLQPAEFVKAGADDAAGRFEIAFNQKFHRDRGRVPTACDKTAKYRVGGGSFVEMERLRIKFGGKALDAVRIDTDTLGLKGLSSFKIFQVSFLHIACLHSSFICQKLNKYRDQDCQGFKIDTLRCVSIKQQGCAGRKFIVFIVEDELKQYVGQYIKNYAYGTRPGNPTLATTDRCCYC